VAARLEIVAFSSLVIQIAIRMIKPALALLEFNSIAAGIQAAEECIPNRAGD